MSIELHITLIISNENECKEVIAGHVKHAGEAAADYIKQYGGLDVGITQYCINADTPTDIDEISVTRIE